MALPRSEASALRCGSIQPQLPIRKMLQRIARRRSRYEALGDLKLSKMEAEVKKEDGRAPRPRKWAGDHELFGGAQAMVEWFG